MNTDMRFLYALIIWTLISASPSWSETLTFDFLVENEAEGLVYKKFSTILFTGTVIPNSNFPMQGSFKKGKREGYWEFFYESGALRAKLDYEIVRQRALRNIFIVTDGYLLEEYGKMETKKVCGRIMTLTEIYILKEII